MSAVTSSFILLLLCLLIQASDARIALGWNPNGILRVVSTQRMSSQKIAASSNENGPKDNQYLIRSTSFLASSSYRMHQVEMATNQPILEANYAKSGNANVVPSKGTFTPHTVSSPEGMFSDYSRPKMRPPSHNR